MRKNFVLGFTSIALAAGMCVGLAGCGGVDAEGVNGVEVTEKEWNAALSYFEEEDAVYTIEYENFTSEDLECVYLDESLSGGYTNTMYYKAVKNAEKEYLKKAEKAELSGDSKKIMKALDIERKEADEEEETYAERTEKAYAIYSQNDDGEWEKKSSNYSLMEFAISMLTSDISFSYKAYEYSAEMKGYILKDALKMAAFENALYVLKFNDDGKLSAIYFESEKTSKTSGWSRTTTTRLNIVFAYEADDIEIPNVD